MTEEVQQPENYEAPEKTPRSFFSRRRVIRATGILLGIGLILLLAGWVLLRFGFLDSYAKSKFTQSLDQIGVVLTADEMRTELFPLKIKLQKATFTNKFTNERLFFIESADIGMTTANLLGFRGKRIFELNSTEINGLQVWINFDAEGKSNYSELDLFREGDSESEFRMSAAKFFLNDGVVHFNDQPRTISGEAKNVFLELLPQPGSTQEAPHFSFNFSSSDSKFVYDEKPIEPVNISAKGTATREGSDVSEFRLASPLGKTFLAGSIRDWSAPKYNFDVSSNVDLTQVSSVFPNGAVLRGDGSFNGKISGEGEKYRIDGEITSDALAAGNIRLKALSINAVADGDGYAYEANGKAIAELLTFGDFQFDSPFMNGNVRGTGTDFRWFGELRAAAAKIPGGTLTNLIITDAVAEYEDENLSATLGNVRTRNFFSKDVEAQDLLARNVRLTTVGANTNVALPNLSAAIVNTKGASFRGVSASDTKLKSANSATEIDARILKSESVETRDAQLKNVTAQNVRIDSRNGDVTAATTNLEAGEINTRDAKIGGVNATSVKLEQSGNETRIYSDGVRFASIASDAAILGSVNVAGVRLSIVEGRIEGNSDSIAAGNVDLKQNGKLENVNGKQLIYVLEPSGRYRASLDLSIGGGILGSAKLGAARARVDANNDQIALRDLVAEVTDGKVTGEAIVAMNANSRSLIDAKFENLDLAKILALQGGKVFPVSGRTSGDIDFNFPGTNLRAASGTIIANFNANAGSETRGLVPINGTLSINATQGLFDINRANLFTEKSKLDATGKFDLKDERSDLRLSLVSSDAAEIQRLITVLNFSPELESQLNSNEIELAGNLRFDGTLRGNLTDPLIDGRALLDSFSMHKRELGSIESNIALNQESFDITDGKLRERGGGFADFSVNIPRIGINNIVVKANLARVNAENILAALAIRDALPEFLRDMNAEVSGDVNLKGLPDAANGFIQLNSTSGTIAGQVFQSFESRVNLSQRVATIQKLAAQFADGFLEGMGNYNLDSGSFDFGIRAKNLQVERVLKTYVQGPDSPEITGAVDFAATISGMANNYSTYEIDFEGGGRNIAVDQNAVGTVSFIGKTENQKLTADLTATIEGYEQLIHSTINFADENLPLRIETKFAKTQLAPFIALFRRNEGDTVITGTATGDVFLEGNLRPVSANGKREFTTDDLSGIASFSEFGLNFNETPFIATEPIVIRLSAREVVVERARFAGAGSNVLVSGTKALSAKGINNLSLDGKINLRILDAISRNAFFNGLADVEMKLTGSNANARLSGSAVVTNGSIATFAGSQRMYFERINGRAIFTENQVQIQNAVGYLGGGKVTGSGGGVLSGLRLDRFRLDLRGTNVTAPLPRDFITTGDAEISITGRRIGTTKDYDTLIAGEIFARRSLYTRDIDLADVVGTRRERTLKEGTTPPLFGIPKLDLRIEGRDALVVKNNLADLTASGSLNITGDVDYPILSGRLTANSGTLFYRNDRYELQRGALEYPPQTDGEPVINLQATTIIKSYQVTVDLSGQLTDLDALTATVRSNPALPQADVVSLITTGNLTNTDSGIPTLAQTGLNTATELLTDALINNPARRATDKLFGLNRFEIDPILSGRRLNPSARLTVGRQINNNLLVTYSTNLSEDQNQVLALEYRVSNRLSFVAQYEQRSLSNITRNRDNFSFEIRLKKRF